MRLARIIQRCTSTRTSGPRTGFRHGLVEKGAARRVRTAVTLAGLAIAATLTAGCDINGFIDPTEMFTPTHKTLQKPILPSISALDPGIDDPESQFVNATEVKPADLLVLSTDYKIGKGDLVNITVNDLVGIGVETTKSMRVSESGNVSLPLLGQVHAEGLTEDELQKAIADAYRNGQIITNATVSVQVAEARGRTFSALGAVTNAGIYPILQADTRMLDALVTFHDVLQSVDEVYVIRQVNEDPQPGPGGALPKPPAPGPTPAPAPAQPGVDPLQAPTKGMMSGGVMSGVLTLQTAGPVGGGAPAGDAAPGIPTPPAPGAATPGTPPAKPAPFAFNAPTAPAETRTIRIPLDALRNGDFRYNIVIRPHDLIIAPNPVVGEYYMGGHFLRTGVYSLSARKITIKQAVVSAGMLDGLAIPERLELIRRIGSSREAFVRLDLDAIFSGTQPDLYLKPNDVVQVGSNLLAPFIQDLRTGFRITYGFGFLYDRNFAPQQTQG